MGRSKKVAAPVAPAATTTNSANTSTQVGNFGSAQTVTNGGETVTAYVPSTQETLMNLFASNKTNEAIMGLNSTDKDLAAYYADMEKAYVNDALSKLYAEYDSGYDSLKEDVASRFGSLNSSQFLNGLQSMEAARAQGTAEVVNNGKMYSNELATADQTQLLNTIASLTSVLNGNYSNAISAINAQNEVTSDAANRATDVYTAQLANQTSQMNNMYDNYTSLASNYGGSVSSYAVKLLQGLGISIPSV